MPSWQTGWRSRHSRAILQTRRSQIRHHQLNDIVRRALVRANIPSVPEPTGH